VISIKISDAKCFPILYINIISLPADTHMQYFPATVIKKMYMCVYVCVRVC